MKRVLLISSILLFIVAFGVAAQDKYVTKADEEIYGTWIVANLKQTQLQKIILSAKGMDRFALLSDTTPFDNATYEIDAKWTDDEGNIWYKVHGIQTSGLWKGHTFVELDKLSKSGSVWEAQFTLTGINAKLDPTSYPKELNPNSPNHGLMLRYRAENYGLAD